MALLLSFVQLLMFIAYFITVIKSKDYNSEDKFTKELGVLWQNFTTEDYYSFELLPYKKLTFFKEIPESPAVLKGFFVTDASNDLPVDFRVFDDKGNIIYSVKAYQQVFYVQITKKGKYSLVFNNPQPNIQRLSILASSGINGLLDSKELQTTHEKIKNLENYITTVIKDQDYISHKHKEKVKSKNIFYII